VAAHLDADAVRLRGPFRLDVPFTDIRELAVRGDSLRFDTPAGNVTLELGASEAAKWLKAIREPKPLLAKLGIKRGMRVCLRGPLEADFVRDVATLLDDAPATTLRGRFAAIVARLDAPAELATLATLRAHLEPAGMLWLIAPKGKSSPVPEAVLRQAYLAQGLVDVKVAAFSPTHTAVKVVIPVAQRV
jgi:hypothetical protein